MTQMIESRDKVAQDYKALRTAVLVRLEAEAVRAGHEAVKPPMMVGASGVNHTFSLLVRAGSRYYGFDEYERIAQFEVMRTHIKRFDTAVVAQIIDLTGGCTPEGAALARTYGVSIISPEEFDGIFARLEAQPKDRFSY